MDKSKRLLAVKAGVQPQSPEVTFKLKSGVCYDAAVLARDSLNRIHPHCNARLIFIKNRLGAPHHWVTAFTLDGNLFIMDFGAGGS